MSDVAKSQNSLFKKAAVIGSGFGGLALAIRLQSAGIQTTILEGRDKPGGRAYYWEKEGFIFDGGPTVITDPDCLSQLWELTGNDMAKDIELMPVSPFYRLNWPDGTNFDYVNDPEELYANIAAIEPDDVEGYKKFLEYSGGLYEEGYVKLGTKAFLDVKSMIKAAPALLKFEAYRSVYAKVSSFVKNEKLREFLSFQSLLVGGNPMKTSAIYGLIHKLERLGGVWFAKGGTNMLVAAMVKHFERIGGVIRLDDIYDNGVLPSDFSLYLHHPTVTDPEMAPEGHSTFYVLAPVPHQGKLPIDWEQMGPIYKKRILDEIGQRLIPDIHDRIITSFHYTPQDFGTDLNAHLGSAFSLEPLLTQSAWFRVHNRDDVIDNLYFVGAGTHPGAGIPGVVGSAKATAELMLEDLA